MANDESIPFQVLERAPTLSDRVTSSVLELITQAALKPGDRLPSERDLGERFGVSRTVVREALRSLAAKGVLDVRSGSGATVATVNVERASEALRLYVQGSQGKVDGVTYEQINDVREMIETRVARIAATSASAEDIARLVAVHEEFCATPKTLRSPRNSTLPFTGPSRRAFTTRSSWSCSIPSSRSCWRSGAASLACRAAGPGYRSAWADSAADT